MMRFVPHEQELLADYLPGLMEGCELDDPTAIYKADIYALDPWDLMLWYPFCNGSKDNQGYFFTPRHPSKKSTNYSQKTKLKRTTPSGGNWHGNGSYVEVKAGSRMVGLKATFNFRPLKGQVIDREFVMHEFILGGGDFQKHALCMIYEKSNKAALKRGREFVEEGQSKKLRLAGEEEEMNSVVQPIQVYNGTDHQIADEHQEGAAASNWHVMPQLWTQPLLITYQKGPTDDDQEPNAEVQPLENPQSAENSDEFWEQFIGQVPDEIMAFEFDFEM